MVVNANVKASKQEFTNHWLMSSCYIHLLYTVYAGSRQPHDTFPSIFFLSQNPSPSYFCHSTTMIAKKRWTFTAILLMHQVTDTGYFQLLT